MLLVVGTVGIDQIETPNGTCEECLGGSAIHFAYAASFFGPVRVVGIVGEDFPREALDRLAARGVDVAGIEVAPGKTFRWSGKYFEDMDRRETLSTELNVFDGWRPSVPLPWRDSRTVFLANGSPRTQLEVLDQLSRPRLVVCDTMDLWIRTEREALEELMRRVNGAIVNDGEALLFTQEPTVIGAGQALRALGPEFVIIKKGTHGALLFHGDEITALPAYPVRSVYDPTGAGDSFAGGFLGYVDALPGLSSSHLRKALAYAACVASFNVEDFGVTRLSALERRALDERVDAYCAMLRID